MVMTGHPAAAPEDVFRFAYAQRKLDLQLASVDAAQGRAAILLGAIGLTASVLLPGAIERAEAGPSAWLFGIGLCGLLTAGGFTGFAVWPRRYETSVVLPDIATAPEMTRSVTATINTKFLPRNATSQKRVWWAVKAGLITFAIHALSWGALHFMEVSP